MRAGQLHIPAMVLIREPAQAIPSVVAKHPEIPIALATSSYIRFYSSVLPCLKETVVAPFTCVISELSTIIERVNARYGTTFREFLPNENMLACVRQTVERIGHQEAVRIGRDYGLAVSLPTAQREQEKERRRTEYLDEGNKTLRTTAESIYERVMKHADVS